MAVARRALGYVRVSKAREEMISPELQITAIEDWCGRNGAVLVDTISDLDATGRNFARAGVNRAIKSVEDGDADLIVVWKWSRFGRNVRDCLVNIDRVEVAGGKVVAATEEFDDSPVGRFGRGQFLLMAEFESARIGEQWKEAKQRRLRQGLPQDGNPRYGYIYDKAAKTYTPDPETGPLLASFYLRYISGEPLTGIVDALNRQGVPGPTGGQWWQTPLTKMLDSGFGAGLIRSGDQFHPGVHEPVIDRDTWEAYLRARRRRAQRPPRHHSPSHPFAGIVFCRTCGGPLVRDGQRTVSALRCNAIRGRPNVCPQPAWITVATLETEVLAWLRTISDPINAKAEVTASQRKARTTNRADLKKVAREINRLETALSRLTRQVAEGLVPASTYRATRDSIQADIAAQAALLQELEDEMEALARPAPRLALDLVRDWPRLDDLGKREVLAALVRRITVRPRWQQRDTPRVLLEPVWEPASPS